jgi:two-component system LytT family response regulator/two-component system response regulator AlgR
MIVEDEPLATRRLVRLLRDMADVDIVSVAENGRAALDLIEAARPNLLLLDIEMPGLDGFELLERMPASVTPAIVFVTAFDRYAYKAFGVRAVDFVLKPVVAERLAAGLANARRDLETREVERKLADYQRAMAEMRDRLGAGQSRYDREFWIQQRSERIRVPTAEIDWIEAEKDYVRIHSGARSYMLLGLIAAVERRLDPDQFMRIHRSAIVRLDRVRSLHRGRYGTLDVELAGGPRLRVGRKYAVRVRSSMSRSA